MTPKDLAKSVYHEATTFKGAFDALEDGAYLASIGVDQDTVEEAAYMLELCREVEHACDGRPQLDVLVRRNMDLYKLADLCEILDWPMPRKGVAL